MQQVTMKTFFQKILLLFMLISKTLMPFSLLIFFSFEAFSQEKSYENDKFLIVLDVQQYWTDKAMSAEEAASMVSAINSLIEKTNPGKVIYVRTMAVAKEISISFKGIRTDTLFAPKFDRNLKIVSNNFFEKTTGDAFATKALTDFLDQSSAKDIIIAGLLAEKCITVTTLGGLSRGYNIYIVPDAVGGKSKNSRNKAINHLAGKGTKILIINDL
jgi:nicotinamidase-related amidase